MDEGASDDVELIEITDPQADPGLLQSLFDTVLRPSFSTDELPSIELLERGALDGQEQTIVVAVDGDGPACAAVYGRPVGSPVGVLSYLASRPGERGRGLGGRVLTRVLEIAAASTVEVVLGEVHDPRWYAESADEQPTARLRFYERHGAAALAVPWMQPRLSPDGDRVRDMLLLAHYATPALLRSGVPSAWLAAWTEGYYVEEEGTIPDDAEYLALMARMTAAPTIALIPVSGVDSVERLALADRGDARTMDPPRT